MLLLLLMMVCICNTILMSISYCLLLVYLYLFVICISNGAEISQLFEDDNAAKLLLLSLKVLDYKMSVFTHLKLWVALVRYIKRVKITSICTILFKIYANLMHISYKFTFFNANIKAKNGHRFD